MPHDVARSKELSSAWLLFLCVVALAAPGCVSKGERQITREAPTGIGPGERIAIVLSDYREFGEVSSASAQVEGSMGHCVRMGMLQVDKGLKFVSPDECRRSVYPALAFADVPRSTEALLESLKDDQTARCYHDRGVRYLVSMSVNITKSARQTRANGICGGGEGGGGCFAYLTLYKEYASVFEGSLVDVNNGRLAGKVMAADKAEAGGGVLLFVILPIPYAYPSAPGTIACRELGRGLAQLIEELDQDKKPVGPK